MKRLVVCCDGTWSAESSSTVSNIVKLAQTIRLDTPTRTGESVRQSVFYVSGQGARGFLADRLLGTVFGLGLDANLAAAYWHLAANWEPGDEIYLFGFSRGAYTARRLAGMIDRIGIMRSDAVIDGRFPQAFRIYQKDKRSSWDLDPPEWRDFRNAHCHYPVKVDFLGVFETVGVLGVPGRLPRRRHRFKSARLPSAVRCARQALAIDERRRSFEPNLWEIPVELDVKYRAGFERVKQVWFAGVHSDVGGGYRESGLSDVALRWMVSEAEVVGLAFDWERLEALGNRALVEGERYYARHDSLGLTYRILNLIRMLRNPRNPRNPRFYPDSSRRLSNPNDEAVRLASSVLDLPDYQPMNLRRWLAEHGGTLPESLIEKTESVLAGASHRPPHPTPAADTRAETDVEFMDDRKVRVWRPSDDPVLVGRSTQVSFAIVPQQETPPSGHDLLPEPVELRVLLESDEARVFPLTRMVVLGVDRTSAPVGFDVVPHRPGVVLLTFLVYRESDGQFLQEVRAQLAATGQERKARRA
ncbi:DUF2235 domain-containing protein [Nocardia crassostreae]|uniref:DUF2235 domain-containing protein n=1 Tax=Nocardia crassostreae TaxID=53428 RepID=UPI000A06F8E4|nr:DUF2235 domain-containing protein [Nocardia crassostreae]